MQLDQRQRSTKCSTGACLDVRWKRSSFCSTGTCVEAALGGDVVQVRDSKLDDSPILTFSPATWQAFIDAVKGAGL